MASMLLQLTSSQMTRRLSQPNRYSSHIRHTVIIHLTTVLFQVLAFSCTSAVLINSSIEEATNCLLRVSFKAEQQLDYWSYKSVCHVIQVGQASSCSKQHSRWHSTNTASGEDDKAGTGTVPSHGNCINNADTTEEIKDDTPSTNVLRVRCKITFMSFCCPIVQLASCFHIKNSDILAAVDITGCSRFGCCNLYKYYRYRHLSLF